MKTDIVISKIRKLDGNLLLIMQQLLQHHSVSKTAEALSLGQSTVSHALTRLRELFDDPLFLRRPHGLQPTKFALELEPKIEALLTQIEATLRLGDKFDSQHAQREFKISAPEFVTIILAAPVLNHLSKVAPSVGVRFVHLAEADAFEQLKRGEIDLALGRFDARAITDLEDNNQIRPPNANIKEPGVKISHLFEDHFCLAARKGHNVFKQPLTTQTYSSQSHIWAYSESETTAADANFDYSNYLGSLVPSWLSALTIAARTNYVATCPSMLVKSLMPQLALESMALSPEHSKLDVFMATRENTRDAGTNWIIQELKIIAQQLVSTSTTAA